ncbi:GNAT family N-acetyltransferase [Caulobacter sp. KR2-114]|uniref:GNAT family N-acetyltransferase n=1 Tax=Caulobacter sp. KR2-114 TaxID=3400912 RepID=UPI003C057BF1
MKKPVATPRGPGRRRPTVPRWLPLETERLILRDVREDDFDDVHEYATDLEVVRYMNWGPNTPEITRQVLDGWLKDQRRWPRPVVNMAAHHKTDGRMIGAVRFAILDAESGTGDFGYSFNRAYWNQGLGAEAAGAVVRNAFETLGLRRMIATCDARNIGSWRVMEKLGMRREALFRQDAKAHDGWRDSYLYAILADEWAAARAENQP